jgi:hypothetical protein
MYFYTRDGTLGCAALTRYGWRVHLADRTVMPRGHRGPHPLWKLDYPRRKALLRDLLQLLLQLKYRGD